MVDVGLAQGLNQLSLTLFTATAPAGALAYAAVTLIGIKHILDFKQKERLRTFLIIPLLFAFLGLIASTNHLGKPANALFVLTGVGRSPLSNEVLATVIFAGLGWLYWLLGFSERWKLSQLRVLTVIAAIAAVAEVWFTANAYSINTIATWSLPFTPVNQVLSACIGAGVITLFTLKMGWKQLDRPLERRILVITLALTVASTAVQIVQWLVLSDMSSAITNYSVAFPLHPLFILVFALLSIGSCAGGLLATRAPQAQLSCKGTAIVLALAMAGILVSRFAFYCTYLTVGIP